MAEDTGADTHDFITSNAQVTVSGIESGAKWDYSLDSGSTWSAGSGASIAGSVLVEGSNHVLVRQTDVAGNQSSSSIDVVKDTQAIAPIVKLANDTGLSASDGLTTDASINVSGLEAGAKWDYSLDNGSTWSAGSGSSISFSALNEGDHHLIVRQTDVAGNQSANAGFSFTLDNTAPTVTFSQPDATAPMGSITSNAVGAMYLIRSDHTTANDLATVGTLDASVCKRIDIPTAGQAVAIGGFDGLSDGSYSLFVSDLAGNKTQVGDKVFGANSGGNVTFSVHTAASEVIDVPDGGGVIVGNGGADRFVFKAGQTGTYHFTDIDAQGLQSHDDMDVIDLSAVLKGYTFVATSSEWVDSAFIKRVNSGDTATILIDADGTGDFSHPDLTLILSGPGAHQYVSLTTPVQSGVMLG